MENPERINMSLKVAKSVTNGGRSLNAIWANKNLDAQEKLILLYLASQLDFTKEFTAPIERYVGTIAKNTGLSDRTIQRRMKSLCSDERRYIKITERKNGDLNVASSYRMTDKIFVEYAAYLSEKEAREIIENEVVTESHQGGDRESPGVVTESHQGGDRESPINPSSSSPTVSNPNKTTRKNVAKKSRAQKTGEHAVNSAPGLKVTKSFLYGRMAQIYKPTTKADVLRALVDELIERAGGDKRTILNLINNKAEEYDSALDFTPRHRKVWFNCLSVN